MSSETLNVQGTGEVDFVVVAAASGAVAASDAVVATVAAVVVVVACAHMHHILPRVRERVCDYVPVCD